MEVEFLISKGEISLILSPANTMEEEILKALSKQENDITEMRGSVQILNKSFPNSVLIHKKSNLSALQQSEAGSDESKT